MGPHACQRTIGRHARAYVRHLAVAAQLRPFASHTHVAVSHCNHGPPVRLIGPSAPFDSSGVRNASRSLSSLLLPSLRGSDGWPFDTSHWAPGNTRMTECMQCNPHKYPLDAAHIALMCLITAS